MKSVFSINLCLDAYEPIFVKLGTMIDNSKLFSLIPVSNYFDLHSRSQGQERARTCAMMLLYKVG